MLLSRLVRRTSTKTSKLLVIGLWEGNPQLTGRFTSYRASHDCCDLIQAFYTQPSVSLHSHGDALQWRHNAHDNVSNHRPHHCLHNRLFRHRSKKTPKLRITGLCAGNSPVTGEFPHKWPVAQNVSIWWRHHGPYDSHSASEETLIVKYISQCIRQIPHYLLSYHNIAKQNTNRVNISWSILHKMTLGTMRDVSFPVTLRDGIACWMSLAWTQKRLPLSQCNHIKCIYLQGELIT